MKRSAKTHVELRSRAQQATKTASGGSTMAPAGDQKQRVNYFNNSRYFNSTNH